MMASIRLLVSDFDRTFTDETLRVAPALADAIGRLKNKGISFSLVSGRNFSFLNDFCDDLDGIVDSFVAENGCIGSFKGKKYVLRNGFDREALFKRLDKLAVPYGYGEVITAVHYAHRQGLMEALKDTGDSYDVIRNVDSLMILPHNISKSSAAVWLSEMHHVSRDETACIGDAENDVSLRSACGLLGAVANAIPEMKSAADYVCKQSNGEGLREFIEYIEARP
jgi:hydroxymethylpyrimidine pyrophosphatase-like HAD family hydrolase